jgi:hypothetical protein
MDWLAKESVNSLTKDVISLRQAIEDGQDVDGAMALWLEVYESLLCLKQIYSHIE